VGLDPYRFWKGSPGQEYRLDSGIEQTLVHVELGIGIGVRSQRVEKAPSDEV
jgi:hypothetical protein